MTGMGGLTLSDRLEVNTVVWLQSLPQVEAGPSRRMTEDLAQLANGGAFAFEIVNIGGRTELLKALGQIADRCRAGLRPILQFDCHGLKDEGLILAPSRERLAWAELAEELRAINVATGNNLCCVFGVCFGLRLSFELRLSRPSPYYLTIAPENEVSIGILEERTARFYRQLFEGGNITAAYAETLAPDLRLFHCKEIFARSLANYVATHCSGKTGAARRERLVTDWLTTRGITAPGPSDLRRARHALKAQLVPSQATIDHFAPTFLIGREPGFDYADVRRMADGLVRRRVRQSEHARRIYKERRS